MPDRAAELLRQGLRLEADGRHHEALDCWRDAMAAAGDSDAGRLAAWRSGLLLARLGHYAAAWNEFGKIRATFGLRAHLWMLACETRLGGRPPLPEPPAQLTEDEALAALELADALDFAAMAVEAERFYGCFLASGHHANLHSDVRARHALTREVLALRAGAGGDRFSRQAVERELVRALSESRASDAARLCGLGASDPGLLMTAAALNETQGDKPAAIRIYRRVLELAETERATLDNAEMRLGLLLCESGESDEALEALRHALRPGVEPAILACGAPALLNLMAERGEWAAAREIAQRLVREAPVASASDRLRLELQERVLRARAGDLSGAGEDGRSLLPASRPEDAETAGLWMAAAFSLEQAGCLPQSLEFYQALLDAPVLPPGLRTNLHYRLGLVLDRLLRFDEAERHLQIAADSDDPFPEAQSEARLRLAHLRFTGGRFDAALPEFDFLRTASATERVRGEAQFRYAVCLLKLGRTDQARQELLSCRATAGGTEFEVRADLQLASLAEASQDLTEAARCYERVIGNPAAEPHTKAGAMARLQALRTRR